PGTGQLSFVEAEVDGVNGVDGLLVASSVAASPDGRHVYVTGQGPDTLVTFAVGDAAVVTTTTTSSTTTTTIPNGCSLEPLAGCRAATGGSTALVLKDVANDGKDQLVMKWVGVLADVADFGDPLAVTDYTFCLYDQQGLLLSAAAPAGRFCGGDPCWSTIRGGLPYQDPDKGLDRLAQAKLPPDRD